MKKLMLILTIGCTITNAQSISLADEFQQQLKDEVRNFVRDNDIPALSVGFIDGQDITFYNEGVSKRGTQNLVTENSVYQIASLSKTVTAIIANNLILESKLSTNESVLVYLPEIEDDELAATLANICISDLLHHTAGYAHDGNNQPTPFDKNARAYDEIGVLGDLDSFLTELKDLGKFSYSNYSYALLGYICERVSQQTYSELLLNYLIETYNFQNTYAHLDGVPSSKIVYPYDPRVRTKIREPWAAGKSVASGGIFSSVKDITLLAQAQLNVYVESDSSRSPLLLTDDLIKVSGNTSYGYGLFKKEVSDSVSVLEHSGDLYGYASFYKIYPKQKKALVFLTSSGGDAFRIFVDKLEKKLLGLKQRKAIELPKAVLKKFEGTYEFESGHQIHFKLKKGKLTSSGKGITTLALHPEDRAVLFYKEIDGRFEFEWTLKDELESVKYIQDGEIFTLRKIK